MDAQPRQNCRQHGSRNGCRLCVLRRQSGYGKRASLVGGLFEKLQDNVSFFGNFADKATPLEEPSTDETSAPADPGETSDAPLETLYTKTEDGLTISFSEIYANDQAVYLSMQAVSEEPFPDTMMDQNGKTCDLHDGRRQLQLPYRRSDGIKSRHPVYEPGRQIPG